MKKLEIEVPDKVASQIDQLVSAGWFLSEEDLTRQVLADFLRRFQPQLQEQFQLQDVAWALAQRKPEG